MSATKSSQRAIIVLRDCADETFTADLSFEPSIKGRKDTTPCIRAAIRLGNLIVARKDQLIAPIAGTTTSENERPKVIITDAVSDVAIPPRGRSV